MKFLLVLSVAVAWVAADVSHIVKDEYSAPIVKSSYELNPEGSYQFAYETANGIYAQASGSLKNLQGEYPAVAVQGGYKYTAPNGEIVEVSYVADEEGFKPVGSHLPVPPPTPEYIARSLAFIAANPPAPDTYKPASVAYARAG